jgi:hypothetical protein
MGFEYNPTATEILRPAVSRASHAMKDVARALGGTGERACTVTVEGTGEHTETVDCFVGDVVYEILREYQYVKRIVIEPCR